MCFITYLGLATNMCKNPLDSQGSEQEMQLWSVLATVCPVGEAFQDGSTTRSIVCLPGGLWSATPKCERKTTHSLFLNIYFPTGFPKMVLRSLLAQHEKALL